MSVNTRVKCLLINYNRGNNEDQVDFEFTDSKKEQNYKSEWATSIVQLEEKLQKIISQNNFNLKSKQAKKIWNSKLNKVKKRERVKINKHKVKAVLDSENKTERKETKVKPNVNAAKPIFNNDGKLIFSKFDFAKLVEKDRGIKGNNYPKKLLDNLKQQEQKITKIAETYSDKANELKEKIAWKNILQKAEGEKEQIKKVSKKKWENRVQGIEKKKEETQKKRKENISKKKEKKAKVVKAAVKRGILFKMF